MIDNSNPKNSIDEILRETVSFVKQLEAVFEGFSENVKVTPIKTPQKPKKRRIKPFTKVA